MIRLVLKFNKTCHYLCEMNEPLLHKHWKGLETAVSMDQTSRLFDLYGILVSDHSDEIPFYTWFIWVLMGEGKIQVNNDTVSSYDQFVAVVKDLLNEFEAYTDLYVSNETLTIHLYLGNDIGYETYLHIETKEPIDERLHQLAGQLNQKIKAYESRVDEIEDIDSYLAFMKMLIDV